jgi:hypothetical protein
MARAKGSKFRGGTSLAQSGGKNTTFGGGKGGTAQTRLATANKREGTGQTANGAKYAIRSAAGDDAPVGGKPRVGGPPPLRGGKGMQAIVKPKALKPVLRGSTNAAKGEYR